MTNLAKPQVLLRGAAFVASTRRRNGRLYSAHLGAGEVVAVDLGANSEVAGYGAAQRLGMSVSLEPPGAPGGADHDKEGTIPALVAALVPSWSDPRSDTFRRL